MTQQNAPQTSVIFVSNMSEDTDEQAIVGHFSQVGRVTNVRIQTKADGSSRGLALVFFYILLYIYIFFLSYILYISFSYLFYLILKNIYLLGFIR